MRVLLHDVYLPITCKSFDLSIESLLRPVCVEDSRYYHAADFDDANEFCERLWAKMSTFDPSVGVL